MSGFITTALGRASAISDVLFGDHGALVLGTVTFSAFELPEKMPWGGGQAHKVHKLPGGNRVIDTMGRDDHAISWSGTFLSSDAATRALAVDEMKIAGQPVTLAWGAHVYTVVITDSTFDDMAPGRVEYHVTVEVLTDNSAFQSGQPPTLLGQVLGDVASAAGVSLPAVLTTATAALQGVQQAASLVTVLTGGSSVAAGLLARVTGAAGMMSGLSGAVNVAISAVPAVNLLGTTDAVAGAASLSSLVGNTGIAATLQAAGGYVARAAKNLAGALA